MAFDYSLRFTGQDDLSGVLGKVKKEIKDMGKEASNVELVDKAMGKIITSSGKLNTKVKQTSALLAEMKFDGDHNAAQFLNIAKAAGEAKDAIGDTQAMIKFFADDRRWLNTTVQGFQALAGVGSIATGVMTMFGAESENAQKAIMKCQQALAILNGVQAVANLLDKEGYLRTAMKVLGLKAEAAATDKATASQTRLNLAVLANPYVMLAMVVAAAAVAIYGFAKSNDEATRAQEDLNKSSENYKKNQESQNQTVAESIVKFKDLQSQWNDLGDDLNAKKKFVDDNKTAFKDLGLKVDGVTSAESVFGKNANAVIAAMRARARAAAAYATMVDNLKDQYAKLAQIEQKLKNGEQFSQSDLADIGILNPDAMAGLREDFTWSAFFGGQKYYTVIGKTAATQIMDAATATVERRADELNKPLEEAMKRAREEAANVPFYSPGSGSSGSSGSGGGSGKGGSGGGGSTGGGDKPAKGSLADLKAEREEINRLLQNENLTLDQQIQKTKRLVELDRQIEDGEKTIAELKAQALREAIQNMTVSEVGLNKQLDGLGNQLSQFVKYWNDKLVFKPKVEPLTPEQVNNNVKAASQKLVNDLEEEKTKKETEALEKKKAQVEAVGDSFAALGSIMSSMGQISDDKALNAAATIAQAIANYILGWSEATAKAAKAGPLGWAAFGLSSLAQVVAVVAQIHSLSGYASGGIISGGSSYGDQILARVNAGEMVLNRKQQSNLFRAIESGDIGAGQTVLVPEFKIKGSDLYGTLRNFSKSVGKTGKVTGIR